MFRVLFVFFFNDTATPEIYTLSLHDALPICRHYLVGHRHRPRRHPFSVWHPVSRSGRPGHDSCSGPTMSARHKRSEEHTSELQSRQYLVCRLLLEKKKKSTYLIYLMLVGATS